MKTGRYTNGMLVILAVILAAIITSVAGAACVVLGIPLVVNSVFGARAALATAAVVGLMLLMAATLATFACARSSQMSRSEEERGK